MVNRRAHRPAHRPAHRLVVRLPGERQERSAAYSAVDCRVIDFRMMPVIWVIRAPRNAIRGQRSWSSYGPSLRVVVRLLDLRLLGLRLLHVHLLRYARLLVAHCSVVGQLIARRVIARRLVSRHQQWTRGMVRISRAARPVLVWRALRAELMQSTVVRKNLTQTAVTQTLSSRERPEWRAAVSWSLKCPPVTSRPMVVVSQLSGLVVCARQPRLPRRELSLECGWNAAVAEYHLTERRERTTRQATILRVKMSRRHQRALVDSRHPRRSKSRRAYGCARGRVSVRAASRMRMSRSWLSRTEPV